MLLQRRQGVQQQIALGRAAERAATARDPPVAQQANRTEQCARFTAAASALAAQIAQQRPLRAVGQQLVRQVGRAPLRGELAFGELGERENARRVPKRTAGGALRRGPGGTHRGLALRVGDDQRRPRSQRPGNGWGKSLSVQ